MRYFTQSRKETQKAQRILILRALRLRVKKVE